MKRSLRSSILFSFMIAGLYGMSNKVRADVVAAEAKDDHVPYQKEEDHPTSPHDKKGEPESEPWYDQTLPEQWYTGSIFSPSPALPEAGMFAVEPYIQGGMPIGRFDSKGRVDANVHSQRSIEQFTLIKYGITKRLSFYMLPDYIYYRGNHQHGSGVQFSDLPVEFQYRFTPKYTPSVSVYLGFNAPTGKFSNLAHASEGVGTGAWFIRYGLHTQFALPFFDHAMRIRLWAQARQPVAGARLRNLSSYGTTQGFVGRGHPGAFGNDGGSLELGITKKWVFALDLYHTWSASNAYRGYYRSAPETYIRHRGQWSNTYNVGPAIEYNWTGNVGGIIGVIVPVIGHNATRSLAPAGAVFAVW